MEHIVQFAISIDDQTIQKRIEENAYQDICNKLVDEARDRLPHESWGKRVLWNDIVSEAIGNFITDHKDEVIDAAAEKLASSYSRTKAYKEKMKEAME